MLFVDLDGLDYVEAVSYLGAYVTAKHGLQGCFLRLIAETKDSSALYLADVYRDGKHIGCIEDDGAGSEFTSGCHAADSESLYDGWAKQVSPCR